MHNVKLTIVDAMDVPVPSVMGPDVTAILVQTISVQVGHVWANFARPTDVTFKHVILMLVQVTQMLNAVMMSVPKTCATPAVAHN